MPRHRDYSDRLIERNPDENCGRRKPMQSKTWGLLVFALGIFCMHVLMTLHDLGSAYDSAMLSIFLSVPGWACVLLGMRQMLHGTRSNE
jgi:hypothetical protein